VPFFLFFNLCPYYLRYFCSAIFTCAILPVSFSCKIVLYLWQYEVAKLAAAGGINSKFFARLEAGYALILQHIVSLIA